MFVCLVKCAVTTLAVSCVRGSHNVMFVKMFTMVLTLMAVELAVVSYYKKLVSFSYLNLSL